ncbi:MFS transporter [Pseudomonas fluorescens]|uniref:Gentisate transporter n=1 Tax=Pseudomonas fluorescens TaxID=294 RepID=A0A5E7D7L6_PSEFL|nr:aromatic acid/H+ symport family MFS transporter [Pseudomonas fluorescens]VVO13333.1 Gentisate transporter [Pseudomonas fluorescens]VVQ13940.1 Gentisate transporter [Pseudomonas fluorescens]
MRKIDINKLIDEARFNPFHLRVLFWATLILIFDGYDLVIYGVVLPTLMQEWGLTPVQAGTLGSCALFGMMFGALILGPLADKVGRKPVIVGGIALFSLFTVLTGFCTDPTQFGICRFIAGFGIGGVMPNAVALMSEYAPKKLRSTLVAIMFSGYSVGGMISAGLGVVLLPSFGWQSLFYVAAIPILLLPMIYRSLPESVGFMVRQGRAVEASHVMQSIEPGYVPRANDDYSTPTLKTAGAPLMQLFREGRAISTLLLWTSCFCCLLMIYALGSWLPKLMVNAGYGLGSSIMFLLVLNFGAIVGAIGGGWLGDRFKLRNVVVVFFVIAAISISSLGFNPPTVILYALVAIAGASTIGTQILAWAFVAQFYPMTIRSTGLGWASGIGRTGAMVGPILGGVLVGIQLPLHFNFMVFALPGAVAALAMCFVYQRQSKTQPQASASAVLQD